MFELAPVEWLQQWSSPVAAWLMAAVSALGSTHAYTALLLVLGFAIRLRPTMGVLLAIFLNGLVTAALKDAIRFPRPEHVQQLQATAVGDPARFDADGFFAFPGAEAIEAVRALPDVAYGFPSGHVSAAMVFCLGVALFFRWRAFFAVAAVWPLLMSLSRMYLGRHFLADVLAGLAVGAVIATCAAGLVRWIDEPEPAPGRGRRAAVVGAIASAVLLAAIALPALDGANVGRMLGFVAIYAVLLLRGFPVEATGLQARVGRLLTAVLLFAAMATGVGWMVDASGQAGVRVVQIVATSLTLFASFSGAVAVGRRMRWYG